MRALAFYAFTLLLSACATQPQPMPLAEPAPLAQGPVLDNLNAVLWQQTAQEYDANAWQSFRTAQHALLHALKDKTWSAAVEQTHGFAHLPPAVVVDVDETMLDNSAFQARLVKRGGFYSEAIWNDWCREKAAGVVPGAVEFSQFAKAHDVRVFYVSNRDISVVEPTRQNLARWNFADSADLQNMSFRDKANGLDSKGARRALIAKTHRILLLVGDNFGDFHEGYKAPLPEREQLNKTFRNYWGKRWIMLPNPTYGSWEQALYGYDIKLSPEQQRLQKLEQLDLDGEPLIHE